MSSASLMTTQWIHGLCCDPGLGVSAWEPPRPSKHIESSIGRTYHPVPWLSRPRPSYSFFVGCRPQPVVSSIDANGCREASHFLANRVMYLNPCWPRCRIYLLKVEEFEDQ